VHALPRPTAGPDTSAGRTPDGDVEVDESQLGRVTIS
jgi:hypothetical protein